MNMPITTVIFFHGFISSYNSFQVMLKVIFDQARFLLHRNLSLNSYVCLMSRIGIRESLSIHGDVKIALYLKFFGNVVMGNYKQNPFVSNYGAVYVVDDGVCQFLGNKFETAKGVMIWNDFWTAVNSIVTCGAECQGCKIYKILMDSTDR